MLLLSYDFKYSLRGWLASIGFVVANWLTDMKAEPTAA
jgi:hypothetical protein